MAQRRFHNYQDPVESSRLGAKLAQMIPPGRYGGFNDFNPSAGTLNFGIRHTDNPAQKTSINPAAIVSDLGLLVSNQGTFIEEDAELVGLSCATNAANAWRRYDAVYVEHEHVNIVGGQAATYGVVTGTAQREVPALPNPILQTLIGVIEIPANDTNLDDAIYHPAFIPTLGAEEDLVWEDLSVNTANNWRDPVAAEDRPQIALDKNGWVHMRGQIRGNSPDPTSNTCVIDIPFKYCNRNQGIPINIVVGNGTTTPGWMENAKIYSNSNPLSDTLGKIDIDRTAVAAGSFIFDGISYYVGTSPSMLIGY